MLNPELKISSAPTFLLHCFPQLRSSDPSPQSSFPSHTWDPFRQPTLSSHKNMSSSSLQVAGVKNSSQSSAKGPMMYIITRKSF